MNQFQVIEEESYDSQNDEAFKLELYSVMTSFLLGPMPYTGRRLLDKVTDSQSME